VVEARGSGAAGDVTVEIQQTLHRASAIQPTADINKLHSCLSTLLKGGLC
jgi:hypothetical protein